MAETVIEENEIKVKDSPKARLEKFLRENDVPIARTTEELFAHSVKDDDGEEVEEFILMREEWRKEDCNRSVDTNIVSYIFKEDTRAELYKPHLLNIPKFISFMSLAEVCRWQMINNWGKNKKNMFG